MIPEPLSVDGDSKPEEKKGKPEAQLSPGVSSGFPAFNHSEAVRRKQKPT